MDWEHLGEVANVAQLTGFDAVKLIGMIVKAANTARMHKKNCRQFAEHLRLIGNLLEQLRISELRRHPETREPLEKLEDALRRSYMLVDSCQNRSYLYLFVMGMNIVHEFRRAQSEIDGYLKLIPLITLVNIIRSKERLESIGRDQSEYTLDDEDMQDFPKFRVKLLSEGFGQDDMDVLCQVGLDGILILEPATSVTLKIYPHEVVTRWEVLDSSYIFAFWTKNCVDKKPRRVRLKSNPYTINDILDAVTAASIQVKEIIGDIKNPSYTEQSAEMKKELIDWRNKIKRGTWVIIKAYCL